MSYLIQHTKLNTELLDVEFLRKTQAQIAKDFSKVDTKYQKGFIRDVSNFEQLQEQVSINLTQQLERGERETLQLMYTIDFPENTFLELTTNPNFIELLSEQIIYREAYKVWLRKNYS